MESEGEAGLGEKERKSGGELRKIKCLVLSRWGCLRFGREKALCTVVAYGFSMQGPEPFTHLLHCTYITSQ